jgi:hypothetical protein
MMGTTHAGVGVAAAAALATTAPELGAVAAVAAIAGGFFPDVDMFLGTHRRTLHHPVGYTLLAVAALALAALVPRPATVAAASFLGTAALHALTDPLGPGDQLRPWLGTSEKGVYCHATGEWIAPRWWVRWDGAPEDLALTALLAVPGLLVFDGTVRLLVAGLVVAGTGYALVRKRLPEYYEMVR